MSNCTFSSLFLILSLLSVSHHAADTLNFSPWIRVHSRASKNGSFPCGVSVSSQSTLLSSYFFFFFFFFWLIVLLICSSVCFLFVIWSNYEIIKGKKKAGRDIQDEYCRCWGHIEISRWLSLVATISLCALEKISMRPLAYCWSFTM